MKGSVKLQTSSSTTTIGGAIANAQSTAESAVDAANTASENATAALDTANTANTNASSAIASANASIAKVDVEYYDSTSAIELIGGSWQTDTPSWQEGHYIWSRTKTTTKSGATSTSEAVCITGNTGAQGAQGEQGETGATGAKGDTGIGVSSIVEQYYLSTSNTEQVGGSWSDTMPTWEDDTYIWTRTYVVWTDGTNSTTTPVLANALNDASSNAVKAQTAVDGLTETTRQQYADITSDISGINTTVADVQKTVSTNKEDIEKRMTSVEETANGVAATVTTQTESIKKVGDDLQAYQDSISNYLTFTSAGLIISASNSKTSVQITDKQINFNDAGYTAAYISGNKLNIPDAVVGTSLRIGKFAFVPRSSENLSLVLMDDKEATT